MLADIKTLQQTDAHALEVFLVLNYGEGNRQLARDYITCMFSNDYRRPTFIIAKEDNTIIGAAAYTEEFFSLQTWGISWVSVHSNHRNAGIGQRLVEECLRQIAEKAQQAVTVILATFPNKTRLYEKIGFVKGVDDHTGGAIMTKVLNVSH
jgi:predicted N-acetyltransferase YhbS